MDKRTIADIYEGNLLIDVNYHSEDVFDADVIIVTLTHKDEGTPRALESFLGQETTIKTAMLIVDDGTSELELGKDKRILRAKIPSASVAVARNLGTQLLGASSMLMHGLLVWMQMIHSLIQKRFNRFTTQLIERRSGLSQEIHSLRITN